MTTILNRDKTKEYLEACELQFLFINMLGWDHGGENIDVMVSDKTFFLEAIANKRGLVVYQYIASSADTTPDYSTRRKIEKTVAVSVHEHIIIFISHDKKTQYWQWVKRKSGHPDRMRQEIYHQGKSGEALIQKLEKLVFPLSEEERLTIGDATDRVRAAFDVEKVTKKFYDRFKEQHKAFLKFIEGLEKKADREWYASLMLNRLMFIYFIQKRGFLDNNTDYLKERLEHIKQTQGEDRFHTFYRLFLLRLFHEGLGQPETNRDAELAKMLGNVPYLNGGLFDVHTLERDNPDINIPDEAFEQIFALFEQYQWHLDDRPLREDNEINPDVLGYIFEKYINQKQMGAYYTKEDITGYISRTTIIPFLFNQAEKDCSIAYKPGGGIWRLLSDDPDRYIFEAVRHGITYDIRKGEPLKQTRGLPTEIAKGLNDVSERSDWNKAASEDYGLPTETWREHVARRQRYEDVYSKLVAGNIISVNDLITYNLDIEKFAEDVIANSEGPELVRAFWKALKDVSILDPTCGSGAFLFAALNILEPLYTTCLEVMGGMLDDLEHSRRKHHKDTMEDFREVRSQVKQQANERYFILKSIIVNNLYGVDIMEEAVEICKLRLFLKLVAQLETYRQLEPLPDIDFNVRTGNSLVGFTTLEEIQNAFSYTQDGQQKQQKMAYAEEKEKLNNIKNNAKDADAEFSKFRTMQTNQDIDFKQVRSAKRELQQRLNDLREKLDRYLAGQYELEEAFTVESYKEWRSSHQPFHWFVEFYGIMSNGGFNVIIGNPPYLEKRNISYAVKNLQTEISGAVHAMCMERTISLCIKNGSISMIVPLSLVSTQRMKILQDKLEEFSDCWYSNYSLRPGKLFDMADQALTIFIVNKPKENCATFSTEYLKWYSASREYLFPTIQYVECPRDRSSFWVPKFGHRLENAILNKLESLNTTMEHFSGRSNYRVYYRNTGGRYWKIFTDFAPKFYLDDVAGSSSRETNFTLADEKHIKSAIAILSSDVFWWWYTVTSNLRDLNPSDWKKFPVPESAMNDAEIQLLGDKYIVDLQSNSTMERSQRNTGTVKTQQFKVQKSKRIIDIIDKALVPHYGFTDEELDFIINYNIKYRIDEISENIG